MLALVIVLVTGWFLASAIGTWAYFVGKSEANILPFQNWQSETYQFLREQRVLKLKAGPKIRAGQLNTVY